MTTRERPGHTDPDDAPRWRGLPAGVWALGFGSLFMDASSELVHSLLPVFMVATLGASMVTVGVVEGAAEATAAVMKVFSGTLTDYLGRRKALVVLGYSLGAVTKPVFPLASSVGWVFTARFLDRLGKGIRGAPRDALVADIVEPSMRGAAYGLRQALDSVGAVIGPLLAVILMSVHAGNARIAMWYAVIPALVTVTLLVGLVREPAPSRESGSRRARPMLAGVGRLPRRYWFVVALGAVFGLARFSEAFLVLRAGDAGLSASHAPFVMAVMSACYAASAYPAGAAADRARPHTVILAGLGLLVAADVVLALASSAAAVLMGAALWGVHMGLTQGLLSKLVADAAPSNLMGTAFGVFNLVNGGALLLASIIAGALWSTYGPAATFLAGATFAALAAGIVARVHGHARPTV